MVEFEHDKALKENGIAYAGLPVTLKRKINAFNLQKSKVYKDPNNVDPKKANALQTSSAIIADEIQTFVEKDMEDDNDDTNNNQNQSDNNQNQTNMKKDDKKTQTPATPAATPAPAATTAPATPETTPAPAATSKIDVSKAETAKPAAAKTPEPPKRNTVFKTMFGK